MNVVPTRDFLNNYKVKGHSLVILKAIELLKKDHYWGAANLAEDNKLPLILGTTWADGWGYSDLDGSQILHYYIFDNKNEGYGYGKGGGWAGYTNTSWAYENHPFYTSANSAEFAEDRYELALSAVKSWGANPKDQMAGWVEDMAFSQNDPIQGKWAKGTQQIDSPNTDFGVGQTPESILDDLYTKYSDITDLSKIFPVPNPACSTIRWGNREVFEQKDGSEWLDYKYNEADSIEAYCGWDGHNFNYYAMWTNDAENKDMIFRAKPNSWENAYFLLGWALHLMQDSCLTIHTINDSVWTMAFHNHIEDRFDNYIVANQYLLPANSVKTFESACSWDSVTTIVKKKYIPLHPKKFFKKRWYCDYVKHRMPTIAEYAIEASTIMGKVYRPFLKSITENYHLSLIPEMMNDVGQRKKLPESLIHGMFALEFDLSIKATAGILLKFYLETEGGKWPNCNVKQITHK